MKEIKYHVRLRIDGGEEHSNTITLCCEDDECPPLELARDREEIVECFREAFPEFDEFNILEFWVIQ